MVCVDGSGKLKRIPPEFKKRLGSTIFESIGVYIPAACRAVRVVYSEA